MRNMLGMGMDLTLVDNMSQGLENIYSSFRKVEGGAGDFVNSIDSQMNALNQQALGASSMMYAGENMVSKGKGVLNYFKRFGQQVVETGADFENSRITLGALYKDVDLAEEKLQWAIDFGAKTPFDIKDTMSTMVGMKAIGVEVDELITTAGGHTQELLGYIGDLGALRPDVGLGRMAYAIRNALGGNTRSLVAALDVNVDQLLGRKFGAGGASKVPQDIADLVEALGAEGLMESLFGTWNQMIAEIGDQMHRIFLFISDAGAFDAMKNAFKAIYDTVANLTDSELEEMGTNISKIVVDLLKPVQALIDFGIKMFHWVTNLIRTQPELVGFVAKMVALGGVALILLGTLTVLSGMIAMLPISLKLGGLMFRKFAGVMGIVVGQGDSIIKVFGKMIGKYAPLALGAYLLYRAYNTNFAGIRDIITNTAGAFSNAFRIMGGDIEDFKGEIEILQESASGGDWYDKLALNIIKAVSLVKGVFDILGDNALDDEIYIQIEALGLIPLLEDINVVKWKAQAIWEGFEKETERIVLWLSPKIKWLVEKIGWVADKVGDFLNWANRDFGEIDNRAGKLNDTLGGTDFSSFEEGGKWISRIVAFLVGTKVLDFAGRLVGLLSKTAGKVVGVGGASTLMKTLFKGALTVIVEGVAGLWTLLSGHPFVAVAIAGVWAFKRMYDKVEWFKDLVDKAWESLKNLKNELSFGLGDTSISVRQSYDERPKNMSLSEARNWSRGGYLPSDTHVQPGGGNKMGMPSASTGGFTKREGLVNLHPNELIVNDNLTKMLGDFLHAEENVARQPLDDNRQETVTTRFEESTRYISERSTSVTTIDKSITIEKGAIEVALESGNPQDVNKLFNALWTKIERKQELEETRNYKVRTT